MEIAPWRGRTIVVMIRGMRNRLPRRQVFHGLLGLTGLAALGALTACGKKSLGTPTTVVRDDSRGLLFTWIDKDGEFHMEESARAVPFEGRDYVRVTDTARADAPDVVTIADLRNTKPDGTYPVQFVTRADFEGVSTARKKRRGGPASSASGRGSRVATNGGSGVIIYGASWCKPCHMAAAHLKRRGVTFVEKDIEEDSGAAQEMQKKLNASGKRGGSIPIIDVRGKILVGFDSEAVDDALASTR